MFILLTCKMPFKKQSRHTKATPAQLPAHRILAILCCGVVLRILHKKEKQILRIKSNLEHFKHNNVNYCCGIFL